MICPQDPQEVQYCSTSGERVCRLTFLTDGDILVLTQAVANDLLMQLQMWRFLLSNTLIASAGWVMETLTYV